MIFRKEENPHREAIIIEKDDFSISVTDATRTHLANYYYIDVLQENTAEQTFVAHNKEEIVPILQKVGLSMSQKEIDEINNYWINFEFNNNNSNALNREELINELKLLDPGDYMGGANANDLLIRFINDKQISDIYTRLRQWYD